MSCSTVSKAFCKSTKIPQPIFSLPKFFLIALVRLIRAWKVEYCFLRPIVMDKCCFCWKICKFYYTLVSPIFFQYWVTKKFGNNLKNPISNPFYEQGQPLLL